MSFDYHETLEKADINTSSSGDNTIIAAPSTGQYLAIDHINLLVNGVVTIQFKAGSTAYGGPYLMASGGALVLENSIHNEHGIITMPNATAFIMNLSAGVQVSGFVRYRIINK